MHTSAYNNAERFYNKYCKEGIETKRVLDVGSMDVNGNMKPIFKNSKEYVGLDQSPGKNVDVVSSSHNISFEDESFDIVISSSCFEHDEMFWVTFLEMCRVTKKNGYIYIQAPSNGHYHAHPVDNWRFYKDAWQSLSKWGMFNGYNVELKEGFVDKQTDGVWHDSVGIYRKL